MTKSLLPRLITLSLLFLVNSCSLFEIDPQYRDHMREFVQSISQYARTSDPDFIIIPQNGPELVTGNGEEDGSPSVDYLAAIDGVGREDLFYGYKDDNSSTPDKETSYMVSFLDICEENGVEVLTTDYCWDHSKMDNSYTKNFEKGYISFAAPDRDLNVIPDYPLTPYHENPDDVSNLNQANNFLYLLDPGKFESKSQYVDALMNTNYDLMIIDLFYEDGTMLSANEINALKTKVNGGNRLVIAYMSIGEAEDYRYYWNNSWKPGSPSWIEKENPDWEGNYKVKYWNEGWQDIIYGNDESYLKKILNAGFDGVYLDIIDAFEYFE